MKTCVIYTHRKTHPDEITGVRDLIRHGEGKQIGERILTGVAKAKIVFVDAGEDFSFPLGQTNILTVGIGKQLFDEHISTQEADRMQACAASLVSEALGIEETPQRKRWLDYVYLHDSKGQHKPMDFADLLAALSLMRNDEEVMNLGIKIIDAILDPRCEKMEMTKQDRNDAANFIDSWLQGKDRETARPIVNFSKAIRNGNKNPFDFTEILKSLKTVYDNEEAKEIAKQLLEAKYYRQKTRYCEAKKLVTDPDITKTKTIIRKDGEFLIVSTKKPVDNEDYNKAARKELGADIVIQQNNNGKVLIFTNAKTPMKKEITNIAGMIRLREMKVRNMSIETAYEKLTYGGAIEEVPQWYFQIEDTPAGGKLLNGSLTAQGVEATAIPFGQILEIVEKALELGFNFKWQKWVQNEIDSRIKT